MLTLPNYHFSTEEFQYILFSDNDKRYVIVYTKQSAFIWCPWFYQGLANIYHRVLKRAAYSDTVISVHGAKPVWVLWGPTEPTCKSRNSEQQKNQQMDEDKLVSSWTFMRWFIRTRFSKICILKKIVKF